MLLEKTLLGFWNWSAGIARIQYLAQSLNQFWGRNSGKGLRFWKMVFWLWKGSLEDIWRRLCRAKAWGTKFRSRRKSLISWGMRTGCRSSIVKVSARWGSLLWASASCLLSMGSLMKWLRWFSKRKMRFWGSFWVAWAFEGLPKSVRREKRSMKKKFLLTYPRDFWKTTSRIYSRKLKRFFWAKTQIT